MSVVDAVSLRPTEPLAAAAWHTRAWRAGRRNPQLVMGALLVLVYVLVGVVGPSLMPYGYDDQDLLRQLRPPVWAGGSMQHPLGTDEFGRDMLTRLVYGARVSLLVGLFSVLVAGVLGTAVGLVGGYLGGPFDAFCMRVADVQYSFPYILLAIVITAFWGAGLVNVIIALGLAGWMTFARAARGSTLAVKQRDYISAARALGAGHGAIMWRHVLPNILPPLLVFATFQVPSRILAEATLSFVGLGVQPPLPSWGNMLSGNRGYLLTQPWLVALPGLALTIVALAVNQLGDGLHDWLDPRLRRRG